MMVPLMLFFFGENGAGRILILSGETCSADMCLVVNEGDLTGGSGLNFGDKALGVGEEGS